MINSVLLVDILYFTGVLHQSQVTADTASVSFIHLASCIYPALQRPHLLRKMQPCGFPYFHSVLIDGVTAEVATPLPDVEDGDFPEDEPYLSSLLLHGLNHLAAALFRADYDHDVIDESRIIVEFQMFEAELIKSCQVVVADTLTEI